MFVNKKIIKEDPVEVNYLYTKLCPQNRLPETWFMLCNKMQIPAHLFTPVRLNMFSTKRGGGLAAAEAMRLVQSALSKHGTYKLRDAFCNKK